MAFNDTIGVVMHPLNRQPSSRNIYFDITGRCKPKASFLVHRFVNV
jgi:hypothetical protein